MKKFNDKKLKQLARRTIRKGLQLHSNLKIDEPLPKYVKRGELSK